ncbi:MAG: cytochrome c-type biogenesis protein CcmH [Burkholderiales bacterium]|jgi:cytochrome c-type biogenesis protein CcmH
MMRMVAGCLLLMFACVCRADEAPPAAADPALEQRVMTLSEELRCLVCQNQSLADSHADLAVDLRNEVREMMREGKTDAQIREFMVARYGDFILYKPPVKASTVVLWVGPFVLLLAAAIVMAAYVRRRARRLDKASISDEERERARDLLAGSQHGQER